MYILYTMESSGMLEERKDSNQKGGFKKRVGFKQQFFNTHQQRKKHEHYDVKLFYKIRHFLQDNKHLKNDVDEVFPSIYVGNVHFARDLQGLQYRGITHILNLAIDDSETRSEYYTNTAITYSEVEMYDEEDYDIKQHLEYTSGIIDNAMRQNGKVLVHCHSGYRRSPTVAIAYMMMKQKFHLWDAIVEARSNRKICPNSGFVEQLCMLERELYGHCSDLDQVEENDET
ncbi:dual specificity protein phosphatase 3-like isoform X4 [Mytilus galloprovincialis]|uniref:dual specificity protein phosphatase 3-like isoform X4 n=1 Tax=Mytilus galloprovincialis TaxID=29158 RepID=UPI003F7CD02A